MSVLAGGSDPAAKPEDRLCFFCMAAKATLVLRKPKGQKWRHRLLNNEVYAMCVACSKMDPRWIARQMVEHAIIEQRGRATVAVSQCLSDAEKEPLP